MSKLSALSGARPKITGKGNEKGTPGARVGSTLALSLDSCTFISASPRSLVTVWFMGLPFALSFDQFGRKNVLSPRAEGSEC